MLKKIFKSRIFACTLTVILALNPLIVSFAEDNAEEYNVENIKELRNLIEKDEMNIHRYVYYDNFDGTHDKACLDAECTFCITEKHVYNNGNCECGAKPAPPEFSVKLPLYADLKKQTANLGAGDKEYYMAEGDVQISTGEEDKAFVFTITSSVSNGGFLLDADTGEVTKNELNFKFLSDTVESDLSETGYIEKKCTVQEGKLFDVTEDDFMNDDGKIPFVIYSQIDGAGSFIGGINFTISHER